MEKVWFKLRQTDYPAPPEETLQFGPSSTGSTTHAPINLGHIIPSLRHLDQPLNPHHILPFPIGMPVYHTEATAFTWSSTDHTDRHGDLACTAPNPGTAGLGFQVAFQKAVENFEEYDRLDTYIVSPTRGYVENCLKELDEENDDDDGGGGGILGRKWAWTVFMVTGLKIARRGGRREVTEERKSGVGGGPQVDVGGIANLTATFGIDHGQSSKIKGTQRSDFVWAVRLAKVHKGLLMRKWSLDAYTTGATFGADTEREVDVEQVLKSEGLDGFEVLEDDGLQEAWVIA